MILINLSIFFRSERNLGENEVKREMPTSFSHTLSFKGLDLSSTAKLPFHMPNSFTNCSSVEGRDGPSDSVIPLDTNQRMMMMLNQGKSANSSMITDDQNERFTEEDEEDDDRNEDPEKGTMSTMKKKRNFEHMEGLSVPFTLDAG